MAHIKLRPSSRSATRLPLLAIVLVAAGCGHAKESAPVAAAPAPAPRAASPAVPAPAPAPTVDDAAADRRAQRAWCDYLDALYKRASDEGKPWPHRDECLAQTSNASPAMLEHTAACSQRALDSFKGDPLTPEYAALVRRCGVEALDAGALSVAALEPYLDIVCRRAETCDQTPYKDCREAMEPRVAGRLGRAIGALNQTSRTRLRECLSTIGCEVPMGDRLSGCIEPIMEKLLWLPAGRGD
ncbi:Hypothetical protein A7982_08426 [Minicystis rosea]|nr:Hypothetical protein A7982_08426 [Minicystis rosea]